MDWEVVTVVVTMPLNVAFWGWLSSHPLALFMHGKAHALGSLLAGVAICAWFLIFKKDLTNEVRIAGAIALPFAAIACYCWWLGRQQRKQPMLR